MEMTDELKVFLNETACTLKGSARRVFMARAVRDLGEGGQRRAERELGWNRVQVRKGRHELESGITCVDGFALRARKSVSTNPPAPRSRFRPNGDHIGGCGGRRRTRPPPSGGCAPSGTARGRVRSVG